MDQPILCYVTDRKALQPASGMDPADTLLPYIERAWCAGADWIQLREKDMEAGDLLTLASRAAAACTAASIGSRSPRILVNDRLDVACAARAGGVHLGEHSIPAGEIVRWRNRTGRADFFIGVSCHSIDAAQQAAGAGADYIYFGPVFATPSKLAYGAPRGLAELEAVCRAVSVPVLAIGGITPEDAAKCLAAGASGIAAIRMFQKPAAEVAEAVARIRG